MAKQTRIITEGAAQEISAQLDNVVAELNGEDTASVSSSDYTSKDILSEDSGRNIATKLNEVVSAMGAHNAPSFYGTCATAAATTAKVVACDGFKLKAGRRIVVKFTYANTASAPTLNVNGTGAIVIKSYGTTAGTLTYRWNPLAVVEFVYDGTYWIMQEPSVATSTYFGVVKATTLNGTENTAPSFYAPTSVGAEGQVLTSNGSGAPSWKTLKTVGTLSVSRLSVDLKGVVGATTTVTVTRSGDGVITAESSDTSVATVSVSDTTITVMATGNGTAVITVKVAEGTSYFAMSCQFSVTAKVWSSVLNDNSWKEIGDATDEEIASSLWPVGATKSVRVSGTVGTLALDATLYAYILDFDHNSTYEGSHKTHFGCFKTAQTGGTDVGLVDSAYGSSYTDGTKYFNMNHSGNYNYGGWSSCDVRYDVLGSTDIPPMNYGSAHVSGDVGYDASSNCTANPVQGTLMAALESELRAVMKPITKYTDNVGGATGSVLANVTATVDYLPLLSEFEVFGTRSYANSYEQNYQAQYAYYANGNSKVKYCHSAVTTAAIWRLRSPYYYYGYYFCAVSASGSYNYSSAYYSRALAPAFAV